MKSLVSSFPKNIVVVGRNGERCFFPSGRDLCNLNRREVSFLASKSVTFLHLICVKHKARNPLSVSSSLLPDSSQVDLETAESLNQENYQSKKVHVKFQLHKQCSFGEQFLIVGDDLIFGLWDPESAVPLKWSDGHVWAVELDIPIGKPIRFKFILRGITGKVLWQPGPDRVLETWETKNTIVVLEDWEDAALQKLLEEEPFANQNGQLPVNAESLSSEDVVADNLTAHNEDVVSDDENGTSTVNVNPYQDEKTLPVTNEKPVVADYAAATQEKHMPMVADNISYLENVNLVNDASTAVQGENGIRQQKDEAVATSNKNPMIGVDIFGSNGQAPTIMNSKSTDVQGNLIAPEDYPVLAPGLTPAISCEAEVHDEGERSIAIEDSSLGVNEVSNHNLPESHDGLQMEEKQEITGDLYQGETIEEVTLPEQLGNELTQKPVARENEKQHPEPVNDSSILRTDIQWGRKTLQKLLDKLGLLWLFNQLGKLDP